MSSLITFPTALFSKVELTLQRAGQVFRSRVTGKRQSLVWPYALWVAECTFVSYDMFKKTDVLALRAFLVDLEGQANVFRLPIVGAEMPSTNYAGAEGIVSGANQIGKVLNTSGWANSSAIAKRGDWISVNDELKMLMQDATSSATGTVTLTFKPALRKAPPNGAAIKVRNITALVSAAKDDIASWSLEYPLTHNFKPLTCIEAFE